MPTPKDTAALTAEDLYQITTMLNRFAWIADEGQIEEFNAFFHPDATWTMEQFSWEGRTAIIDGLLGMRTAGYAGPLSGTRHLMTNIDIDASSTQVRARSIFTLCSGGAAPVIRGLGTYTDALEHTDLGWVLRERVVRMI